MWPLPRRGIFTEEERNKAETLAFNNRMNLLETFPVISIEKMKERGLPLDEIESATLTA